MICPNCGREIQLGNVRPVELRCPLCNEYLRKVVRGGRIAGITILFLACCLCYAVGVRGVNLLFPGVLVYLFIGAVYHMFTSIYWPKYEKDPTMSDEFPHIVLPPDRLSKP